ncbi:MAG: SpoIIE family protein phosphatase [bacterium]|nr:SpoIIE family protein phosphatase [bacterium]
MEKKVRIEKLVTAFETVAEDLKIGYVEVFSKRIVSQGEDGSAVSLNSLYGKQYRTEFSFLSLEDLNKNDEFLTELDKGGKEVFTVTIKPPVEEGENAEEVKEVHCTVYPLVPNDSITAYILFQGSAPVEQNNEKILDFFSGVMTVLEEISLENDPGREKYKKELVNMRDMKAKLFPKFDDVEGFDISSAYLPADLMTGNFIDGFALDETTYQVVACDVTGYDAASSFAGAAIRTLVRSEASKKMVPSAMVEMISKKLKSVITGVNAMVFLTVFQVNIKTGKAMLSSYGPISTVFYSKKRKGFVALNNTEIGRTLAKRNFFKDIAIVMEEGDSFLYYSNGILNACSEDGRTLYGESRLIESFVSNIASPSVELIHSLIEALYEFTDYSPVENDIILISIKKGTPQVEEPPAESEPAKAGAANAAPE